MSEINIPCIVKPNNGGSSIGVSKVNHIYDLENKIKIAFKECNEVLNRRFSFWKRSLSWCYSKKG